MTRWRQSWEVVETTVLFPATHEMKWTSQRKEPSACVFCVWVSIHTWSLPAFWRLEIDPEARGARGVTNSLRGALHRGRPTKQAAYIRVTEGPFGLTVEYLDP